MWRHIDNNPFSIERVGQVTNQKSLIVSKEPCSGTLTLPYVLNEKSYHFRPAEATVVLLVFSFHCLMGDGTNMTSTRQKMSHGKCHMFAIAVSPLLHTHRVCQGLTLGPLAELHSPVGPYSPVLVCWSLVLLRHAFGAVH